MSSPSQRIVAASRKLSSHLRNGVRKGLCPGKSPFAWGLSAGYDGPAAEECGHDEGRRTR
ncbi:protein of unknown function [Nitrospira defluvii]|uniref:Uncharacterized protein n=1 Tax=Nitrospira defluvii TaxID=330214 RepID=D8PEX3_9BACT|nr:protein of unknown function [Nitrospira defluvii]